MQSASIDVEVKDKTSKDPTSGPGSELYDVETLDFNDEKVFLNHLREEAIAKPRRDQRDLDVDRDHLLALLSRQKNTSLCNILCVFTTAMLIFLMQGIALYNLQTRVGEFSVAELTQCVDLQFMSNKDDSFRGALPTEFPSLIRAKINSSEVSVLELPDLEFCFKSDRLPNVIFNLGAGVIMIYAFIFNDLWFVIMQMPLTRSFPLEEPRGLLMVTLIFILVLVDSAILAWLGIISGLEVLSGVCDFKLIIITSVELFIILMIDDVFLPAIRYFVEEFGSKSDPVTGELTDAALKRITHGKQYYKPGYGRSFIRRLTQPNIILRIVAVLAISILIGVVVVPFVVTIARSFIYLVPCPADLV